MAGQNPFEIMRPFSDTRPEVDETEQRLATTQFSVVVEDLVLNGLGGADSSRVFGYTTVHLRNTTDEGTRINARVETHSFGPSRKLIAFSEWDGRKVARQAKYRIGEDGVVRRADGGPAWDSIQQDLTRIQESNPPEVGGLVILADEDTGIAFYDDAYDSPAARQAESLGIYNQPVDSEEISRIADFVLDSEIYDPYAWPPRP